ncbi:dihydrolipoamide acetyltransferase family protein [Maricurvus nonylphenolicus]|uniref:dihydrolipoamide acetyltransferase family protein n=1 Tax=Maricurvus nonylphenolicus TaxID=1008307 RepID=UPI0036F23F1F
MRFFKLPDLGEGLQEAEIVEWHINPGDTVKVDQLLVSVETAKAIVEVPSPQAGTISHCFGDVGDLIHIGEPLVEFDNAENDDSGTVVGKIESAKETSSADDFIIGAAPSSLQSAQQSHPQVTPAIRQLATRLGVKLDGIRGTGQQGQITAADIETAQQQNDRLGQSEPLRGTRRTMAKSMTIAHEQVAAVTLCDDADVEHWPEKSDITIRLCKAIAHAAQAEPGLNAWFDGQQLSRRLLDHVDIGIAVDTPDGLFVPVLRNIHKRNDSDLREGLDRLRQDVKQRTIPPKEMQGATITLSNFGTLHKGSNSTPVMAGRYASPMIVPPMVAIIGAGAIRKEAVVVNDEICIHRRLPLSLSFDHRCITGGEAARFLAALIAHLQD